MNRTIPPLTNAGGSLVRVTVTTESKDLLAGAGKLKREIEKLMHSVAERSSPMITIDVTLFGIEQHETSMSRTRTEWRNTGTTRRVWNELLHQSVEYENQEQVQVPVTYKRLTANATGTYKIATLGVDIAAGSFDRQTSIDYFGQDDSYMGAEDAAMEAIAPEIAAHLVPLPGYSAVLLPYTSMLKLDQPEPHKDWRGYLSWLEEPSRTVTDEAYRQYEMAIAKEALANDPFHTREESLALFRSAVDHLERAIRLNSNEPLFHTDSVSPDGGKVANPLARMYDSLASYEKWIPQRVVYEPEEYPICNAGLPQPPPELLNNSTAQQPPHR